MSSAAAFFQFWWTDLTRDAFLACLPKEDLLSMRLVCHDFAYRTAPVLFAEVDVEFRNGIFTRPARMAALERIGSCIKSLNFNIPHSPETFLPPLLDPVTGEERTFVYEPQVYASCPAASRLSFPRYGTWEMTELLTRQYPPLFHAVTNVPSFIRAFNAMTSLRHLKVSCNGQGAGHRYRRSVVDYALISLRIAIEQAPLKSLDTLSLLPIHPGALLYLRPNMGFGASPSSRKRWAQIRKLSIEMDSFPYDTDNVTATTTTSPINTTPTSTRTSSSGSSNSFKKTNRPKDHLKLLHSYLQSFPTLTHITFRWRGTQGPCPLSLSTEPCLQPTATEPASTLCPKRCPAPLQPLSFPHLLYAEIENALLDAAQVSAFILEHRQTLGEFYFENTSLRDGGTWDEALAPLTEISGSERWKGKGKGKGKGMRKRKKQQQTQRERERQREGQGEEGVAEEMDVPIMFSPVGMGRSQVLKVLWEEERRKDRLKNFRAYGAAGAAGAAGAVDDGGGGGGWKSKSHLQRASSRTRDLLWCRQDHVKRFLRTSVFSWR
ncbi:hypothetical protein RJZ56_005745 [Blastomyces dermatitidis]|uniref:Uncharacterized protein n=1 Tax=Ajellomyces dermatitidis (strain ATCC 18188 / CBS 674.68) TaxID=653446 RepID=F2TQ56_AJEDA|nr:hypothetical protein BDDG_08314 [Blastomyces dermatitidis ATCC 18188]